MQIINVLFISYISSSPPHRSHQVLPDSSISRVGGFLVRVEWRGSTGLGCGVGGGTT